MKLDRDPLPTDEWEDTWHPFNPPPKRYSMPTAVWLGLLCFGGTLFAMVGALFVHLVSMWVP